MLSAPIISDSKKQMGFLCAFFLLKLTIKAEKIEERCKIHKREFYNNIKSAISCILLSLIPFKPELRHSALDRVVSLPATRAVNTPQRVIPDPAAIHERQFIFQEPEDDRQREPTRDTVLRSCKALGYF